MITHWILKKRMQGTRVIVERDRKNLPQGFKSDRIVGSKNVVTKLIYFLTVDTLVKEKLYAEGELKCNHRVRTNQQGGLCYCLLAIIPVVFINMIIYCVRLY